MELARRLDTDYDVTPDCLRAGGPWMERLQNSTVSAIRFSWDSDGKLIVLVGNMHSDVKGHELLISATSAIVGEFPSAYFILVGDSTQRQQFERAVSALSLAQRFLFVGQCNDIPEFLACCDVAVLPSNADGLPNAVLKYMAAGLPVVSSNVGGNSESIRDGTGLLVPSQDAPGSSARRCSDCCAIPAWRAGLENQARHMSARTSALND